MKNYRYFLMGKLLNIITAKEILTITLLQYTIKCLMSINL